MQLFDAVVVNCSGKRVRMKRLEAVDRQPCRLATCSSKRARMQLFDDVGWQPAAVKGLGCCYLTL